MKGTVFYKMTGSGNDFIMLDGRYTGPADWPAERIVELCDRRMGVGADGLVILTALGDGRVRMDFWNCDGSRAAMCGNAALCSTRLAAFLRMAPAGGMRLVTDAGEFLTRCRATGEEAELNLPDFALPDAPPSLRLRAGESDGTLVVVGVPHLVIRVENLEQPDLMTRGCELRWDPVLGPAGANVNFVTPANGEAGTWSLRTYERGVEGETLACGTGAVAAAAALAQGGFARLPVRIRTRSGRILTVSADLSGREVRNVWLAGEGRLVFTGVL
ncbi:MAG TPA: diaminopimelate epimerase [Gemmatimonadales bacterium]|jgi:diaminopimelate epimerase|nr:diaminopimelate epimerase [Gemmatimonadales bacterium]